MWTLKLTHSFTSCIRKDLLEFGNDYLKIIVKNIFTVVVFEGLLPLIMALNRHNVTPTIENIKKYITTIVKISHNINKNIQSN